MQQIKFILVNDSATKGSGCESRQRFIPPVGHCIECFAGSKFQVELRSSSSPRQCSCEHDSALGSSSVQGCLSASSFAPRDSSSKLGLSSQLGVGSRERVKLLDELVHLRRQWPDAKILGVKELDPTASHTPIRVSPEMNRLRRALSDLP